MQILNQRPHWLKKAIKSGPDFSSTRAILEEYGLNTVCRSAKCPNIFDCFSKRVATFLILGDICTRGCAFCAVSKGGPADIDPDEPGRVAEAVCALGLKSVVITSVTRDDLADGGAGQFAKTVRALRRKSGGNIEIEVLAPDFKGDKGAINTVAAGRPDIFGHNIETVPRLYGQIRPGADYKRSLSLLKAAKETRSGITIKSGMMAGLGETRAEIISVMADLKSAGCDIFTIGQYLRPSTDQVPVERFITPDEFLEFKKTGLEMGF
jgi:lipoic acid synthetase